MSSEGSNERPVYCDILLMALLLTGCGAHDSDTIVIGGKKFSEQSILGEMFATLIEKNTHLKVERRFWLGGTQVVHQAILKAISISIPSIPAPLTRSFSSGTASRTRARYITR